MFRKCILVTSVFVVLGIPFSAHAQTMDIAMKIQSILDQFSEIRSGLKQVQSGKNIESMMQNLKGSGDWKAQLKSSGSIFDKDAEKGGTKQSLLLLPDGLADKAEDQDAATDWVKENMFVHTENPDMQQTDELTRKRKVFKYTTLLTAYGKAIVIRRQLDKDIETIEKLRQDAQSKNAETDLQNEINKVALLKLEQTNYRQLLATTRSQVAATLSLTPLDRKNSDKMSKK